MKFSVNQQDIQKIKQKIPNHNQRDLRKTKQHQRQTKQVIHRNTSPL